MAYGGQEELQDIPKSYGWKSTEQRLHELCKFLASEGLTLRTVGFLGDPAASAPQFAASEAHGTTR